MGLLGVCMGLGGCRDVDMGAFRFVRDEGVGKTGGGGGSWSFRSPDWSIAVMLWDSLMLNGEARE